MPHRRRSSRSTATTHFIKCDLDDNSLAVITTYLDYNTIRSMSSLIEPAHRFMQFTRLSGKHFWTEWGGINVKNPDQSVQTWDITDQKRRPRSLRLDDIPLVKGDRSRPIDIFVNIVGPVRGVYVFLRQIMTRGEEEVMNMSVRDIFNCLRDYVPPTLANIMYTSIYGMKNIAHDLFDRFSIHRHRTFSDEISQVQDHSGFKLERPGCRLTQLTLFQLGCAALTPNLYVLFFNCILLHGDRALYKRFLDKYGDPAEGTIADRESLDANTIWNGHVAPMLFDSLNPDDRLCQSILHTIKFNKLATVSYYLYRVTALDAFHSWYLLYRLTGSSYAYDRLQERQNRRFLMDQIQLLRKYVFNERFLTTFAQARPPSDKDSKGIDEVLKEYVFTKKSDIKTRVFYKEVVKHYTREFFEERYRLFGMVFDYCGLDGSDLDDRMETLGALTKTLELFPEVDVEDDILERRAVEERKRASHEKIRMLFKVIGHDLLAFGDEILGRGDGECEENEMSPRSDPEFDTKHDVEQEVEYESDDSECPSDVEPMMF